MKLTPSKVALFLASSSTTSAFNVSRRSLSHSLLQKSSRPSLTSVSSRRSTRSVIPAFTRNINNTSKNNFALNMSTSTLPTNEDTSNSRVALLQFKVTDEKEHNHSTARSFLRRAHEKDASLAVLPEIWNSPYATSEFAKYAEVLPDIDFQFSSDDKSLDESPSAKLLFEAAIQYKMYIIGGSIPEKSQEDATKVYNTCLIISPSGKLIGKHAKVHLFDIDVPGGITFKESDTLSPGNSLTAFSAGSSFGNIGVGICYDIRFPEYALLLNQKYKCNLLVYPGAFNMTTGPAHWELLQRARAVDNQCFVAAASPARVEESEVEGDKGYKHYTAWGHSTVISPWGEVVGTCGSEEDLVVVDLDMGEVKKMREGIPTANQKRDDLYRLEG